MEFHLIDREVGGRVHDQNVSAGYVVEKAAKPKNMTAKKPIAKPKTAA